MIALQLNNWNESKNQRHKEIVILKALKYELKNDLNTEFIDGNNSYLKRDKTLIKLVGMYTNKETIPRDSLVYYFDSSLTEWNFSLNGAAFENLKSTGINLISNDSLRFKISSLYSNHYPEIMIRDNFLIQFSEREFKPILFDYINFNNPTLSQNEFDYLINSKQIGNRIVELYELRYWMLAELQIIIPELESLIRDIDKEIKRIEK